MCLSKIFRDFEIQTDPPIQARRSDLLLINKRKRSLSSGGLCCSSVTQNEKKNPEKIYKYLDIAREHENDSDNNFSQCL